MAKLPINALEEVISYHKMCEAVNDAAKSGKCDYTYDTEVSHIDATYQLKAILDRNELLHKTLTQARNLLYKRAMDSDHAWNDFYLMDLDDEIIPLDSVLKETAND
jgi:hypothetical protein